MHVELTPLAPPPAPAIETEPTTCPELEAVVDGDASFDGPWRALPDAHRAEYGRWISAGADPEVRLSRIARLRHRLTGR